MKNLMIFINPTKGFTGDFEELAKLQIDHSLDIGWEKEDIIFATNFDWEYNGVKSTIVSDDCYYMSRPRATKLLVICYLLNKGLDNDVYWFHDLDAYQLEPFETDEPYLGDCDAGFVFTPGDYPYAWNSGSFFFKPSFKDVFNEMKRICHALRCHDEQALCTIVAKDEMNIGERYKRLNCTYNLCRLRGSMDIYKWADKPIKVLHDDLIAIMNL